MYQGYKNRSTWLANLHLQNESEEIHNKAVEIVERKGQNTELAILVAPLLKEENTDINEVEWSEIRANFLFESL